MGYLHIDNLYKNTDILMFKQCYALEKMHGSSAHISFKPGDARPVKFFAGGESHERFVGLFNQEELEKKFVELGNAPVIVYGEVYGGKCQGMKDTYGVELRFIAFDVKIDEHWLNVPNAEDVCKHLGVEFVHYELVDTDVATLDAQRDAPSVQAKRNGIEEDREREGVVLRPVIEMTKNNGERIISKHKGDKFKERQNQPKVQTDEELEVLNEANAIAEEWVTPMRLTHVLDKLPQDINVESTGTVIRAMVEDVIREAKGEIVESKAAKKAISKKAAWLFKQHIKNKAFSKSET